MKIVTAIHNNNFAPDGGSSAPTVCACAVEIEVEIEVEAPNSNWICDPGPAEEDASSSLA
jgi:hypothetical protein